uniref:Guanylate cyclase domain-containing protein n=1 Tax=Amphora coffeiformis TaxID=265554 RepID=A0A7S3P845_9STRA
MGEIVQTINETNDEGSAGNVDLTDFDQNPHNTTTNDNHAKATHLREMSRLRVSTGSIQEKRAKVPIPPIKFGSTGHFDLIGPLSPSGRTRSTAVRLQRQGFTPVSRDTSANFVVKSIRRGTEEWHDIVKPFVADLAFRSLVKPRYLSKPRFQAYECHAAVLFVDLSGYSKITAALSTKGAHAVSNVVNAYLGRLLLIVNAYGGDVVKFAGDAVLICWEGTEEELEMNVLSAAVCVMELQRKEGRYEIEGTDLAFQIHCGLACGVLESEVFQTKHTANMQALFHSVGGAPVDEIGELVDFAKAGEVCVSRDCLDYLETHGEFRNVDDKDTDGRIMTRLNLNSEVLEEVDDHVVKILSARLSLRDSAIEEDFIHPSVLQLLSHGGLSPTQIAQMRNLCVLFIGMIANGSSVNWLTEVQAILDRHRCPIVQIIDDDKGVHLVAAINLYEAIPEAAVLGLEVCEELQNRQVGCAIGMAMGSTHCGVTGSSSIACRWDITGPPAVRAARLMQYAIKNGLEFAVDHSIYQDRLASSKLELLQKDVAIKGTQKPILIYTLSKSIKSAALHILESVNASVHDTEVRDIQEELTKGYRSKRTIVITGPPQTGKKFAAQRAAGYSNLTPFLHVSSESAGHLQLARTIATWYQYVNDPDIRSGALEIVEHLNAGRWSRAHDNCIEVLNFAVTLGLKACFVVDRVQFLDEFSCSIIRECCGARRAKQGRVLSKQWSSRVSGTSESSDHDGDNDECGVVCFLCIHVALYQWPDAQDVAKKLSQSGTRVKIPVITLGRVSTEDLRLLFRDLADMEVHDRFLQTYAESSGYCAGYFIERTAAMRRISATLWAEGKAGYAITNQEMMLQIPHGMIKKSREISVHQVSAEVAMKYTQLFDELPPLFQTFLKVLTMGTKGGFFPVPRTMMWEVLNDLIEEGVERHVFDIVVKEMQDMHFIAFGQGCTGEQAISLLNPAMADITFDVCTPEQIDTICAALLDRMEVIVDTQPSVSFVMATFHHRLGSGDAMMIHFWRKGYSQLKKIFSRPNSKVNMMKEIIDEEIKACGLDPQDVLDKEFSYPLISDSSIGTNLPMCKVYMGPITLGPMGQTLTVLTRNLFHEMKHFRLDKPAEKRRLMLSFETASERYCEEVQVVERFLAEYGLEVGDRQLTEEFELIMDLAQPANCPDVVQTKAVRALNELIPIFIEGRRERILQMYRKVREEKVLPQPMQGADPILQKAFEALQSGCYKCTADSVHDALMVMAVNHWKPKRVSELLPITHHQTLARIRNKVLIRLSPGELSLFKHQQGPEDFGAFLIMTALLCKAGEKEKWYM